MKKTLYILSILFCMITVSACSNGNKKSDENRDMPPPVQTTAAESTWNNMNWDQGTWE